MSVAVLVLRGRSGCKSFLLAAPGHSKGCQDGFGGSLCTASEGGLPALHGNTSTGSVGVLAIQAFLGYRFAWLRINLECSANRLRVWIGGWGRAPELGCVLIFSHQPPLSITVVCGLPSDHINQLVSGYLSLMI